MATPKNRMLLAVAAVPALSLVLLLAGCGSPTPEPEPRAQDGGELPADAGTPDATATCNATPGPADGPRHVVVSHPYDDDATDNHKASAYEVLELSAQGTLATAGKRFELGRSIDGEIVFTPDGRIGLVAQEDGSIGVFRFADTGDVEVVLPAFTGDFYASRLVMDPSGRRVLVVDGNWAENGGGIHEFALGCFGHLSGARLLVAAKLASTLHFLPGNSRAVVTAAQILDSPAGAAVHLLDWGPRLARVGSADPWGDDDASVSDAKLTADGRYLLVGDNGLFSNPHRLAAVEVTASGLRPAQVIAPVKDPAGLATSPFGNAALALSAEGDDVLGFAYDPANAASPFTPRGPVAYRGARPQLPTSAVVLQRGQLRGRVLVAELMGVRQLQFEPDGRITDLGLTSLGAGFTAIVGALGVQP